jgi:hypothetical protein
MSTDALESPLARLEQTTTSGPITHLPIWAGITASDVEPGVTSLVETVRTEFEALEADLAPTWEGVMEPLERIEHRLEAVIGSVTHLTSVKYSDDMQEAYDTVRPAIVAISNTMSQSRAVYDAMAQLRSSSEGQNLSVATGSLQGDQGSTGRAQQHVQHQPDQGRARVASQGHRRVAPRWCAGCSYRYCQEPGS